MDPVSRLLQHHPLVAFHIAAALTALVLGAVLLRRTKGTAQHRGLGWAWVLAMGATALSSGGITDGRLAVLMGFSPIHLLTVLVLFYLPRGVLQARRGDIAAHRQTMRNLYIGGCVVAGLFTLLPGRFLGQLLWHHGLGIA